MKTVLQAFFCTMLLFWQYNLNAQCTFSNNFNAAITLNGNSPTSVTCVQGGQYVSVNVVSGQTYTFTTCNSVNGGDSQITLFNSTATGTSLGYNDDACGLFSTVNWTATFTGTLYIQVNSYNCVSATTCFRLEVTCNSCASSGGGCSYTLELFDSFGDGWNGASLQILVNGTLQNTFTLASGSFGTFNFSVANQCDVIVLNFVSGLWNNEIAYDLYQLPNLVTPIFSADYFFTALIGPVFNTTCGTGCGGPSVNNVTCDSMAPICTQTGVSYPAATSGVDANTSSPGPNYGCLGTAQFGSAPDPTWWYLEISQSGNIDMLLSAPADIDFIIWGPFPNLATARSRCSSYGQIPTATNGSIIDCSYNITNNETPSIPGAITGQVYVMMITNFAAVPQNISLTQTGGTGATNCVIVNCLADAGTVSTTYNGTPSGNTIVLCKGDCFTLQTDSNFVLPNPVSGEVSELMYAIYDGLPNPAITDPALDPNFSSLFWTGDDFSDCNNPSSIILGAGLGSRIWMVPITMDDSDNNGNPNNVINYDNNGDGCYDMGIPIEIVFLDSIRANILDNCGSITITLSGGYPDLNTIASYVVTNTGPGTITQSGANGEILTFSAYTPGQTISFLVNNDGNGCSRNFSYTTNAPLPVNLVSITNANCGSNNGAVDISFAGSCTYTLNMFDSYGDGWNGASLSITANGVPVPGSPFSVSFAQGFSNTVNFTVAAGQTVVLNYSPGTWEGEVTYNLVFNGTTLYSAGPNPPTGNVFTTSCSGATYQWSNGANSQDITGLSASTYTVTVTDAFGCTSTGGPYTVDNLGGVTATLSSVANLNCAGLNSGAINILTTGGTAPITFLWNDGPISQNRTGLAAGVYTVTITDASGCFSLLSATITQPAPLTATNSSVNANCNAANNGSINLTAGGGTGALNYNWGGGISSDDRTGLAPGVYTVTVTDANGCSTTSSATITQPSAVTVTNTSVNANCNAANNGSINITAGGGTGAIGYNWGGGISSEDRTGLAPGVYTVTVTDANGCSTTSSATITEPAAVTATNSSVNANCNAANNGSINITAGGGTGAIGYNWGGGITSEDRTGLAPGVYTVTVTDANGCSTTSSATITEPAAVTATNTSVNANCNAANNGSINITAGGGTGAIGYNWGGGISSEDRTGLAPGVYTVTVTDANGCSTTSSATITEPASLNTNTVAVTDATCLVGGSVNINISGGTGAYIFIWSNGATTEDISGISAGNYTLTVTDANGCSITNGPNFVNAIGTPIVTASTTNVICNAANNGTVNLSVNGGTAGYTYLWNNGSTNENLSGLGAGIYAVTVTDNLGCTATVSNIVITEPSEITISNTSLNVSCNGDNNGNVQINVSGGSGIFTFVWSNGATTEDLTAIPAGAYSVTVSDANNCTSSLGPFVISQPNVLSINNISTTVANCGLADGSISLSVSGGVAAYNYLWNNGATTEDLNNIPQGNYSLTVTDANACQTTQNMTVNGSSDISIAVVSVNENCGQPNSGSVNVTSSGGTMPLTYIWSNGATTEDLNAIAGGTYSVTVTDGAGCTVSDAATVSTPFQTILNAAVIPSLATDTTITWGDATALTGGNDQSALGVSYEWTSVGPSNANFTAANSHNTDVEPDDDGEYLFILTATSADGCIATDTLFVTVIANNPAIPTAFSPNNDGTNDIFRVVNMDKKFIREFKVYNRWGQLVYDNAEEAGWDGKFKGADQPRDVYMYIISWDSPTSVDQVIKRGQVTLMR